MTSKLPERLRLDRLATPIGEAMIVTDEAGYLRAFEWSDCEPRMTRRLRQQYGTLAPEPGPAPSHIKRLLTRYFEGDLGCLGTIEWRMAGTPFQQAVWNALMTIAAGQTLSYGALAAKLGCPQSIRAVASANGANPSSVVVPCHRVIGTDGSLTGYSGGIHRKRWLLEHEGATFPDRPDRSSRVA